MKRSRWIVLGLALVVGAGALVAFLGPRPPEELPLAELVPADAVFYAGFPDCRRFEELLSKIPGAWTEGDRKKFEEAKPYLAGPLAIYVDSKGEWVGLARLTRAAALVGGAEVIGDAAVFAQTLSALDRFRSRTGTIRDVPTFRQLRSRFFLNLESFDLKGPWADSSAVGFDFEGGAAWAARGRAAYKSDRYRFYLERYVQTPHRAGAAEGGAPVQVALTDPFLRLWDEILEGLDSDDRERVERETQILRRDLLGGQDVREFLARLGPRWGFSVVATPHSFPALVGWLDLPDEAARETLEKLLGRAAQDWENLSRRRGQGPWVEVEKGDGLWRLKFPKAAALRLGRAFTPAYKFAGNRLVFSTCEDVLAAPVAGEGDAHAALGIKVAPALDRVRQTIPFFADRAFRSEADGMAAARYLREFNPVMLGVWARKFPDPFDRARELSKKRGEFVADALAEIAKSQKYKDEVARREKAVAALSEGLGEIDRVAGTGRFTGEGLEFELRAWQKEKAPPAPGK